LACTSLKVLIQKRPERSRIFKIDTPRSGCFADPVVGGIEMAKY